MSKSKARIHLDRLSERHHDDDDFDFDGEEEGGHLPTKTAKGYMRSGARDWDYDAVGTDRNWKEGGDVHSMVAANLPLAKTIAGDFTNIPGADPDEIMSAAKEALYSAVELYTPERGKFSTWLSFIVRQRLQALYNVQRKFADNEITSLDAPLTPNQASSDSEEVSGDNFDHADNLDNAYGREGESALRNAARSEAQDIVRQAVEKLDPLYRRIVTMHHSVEGGLSVRDIADQLKDEGIKLSSQTVWKYLNKGMAQVKEILQGAGFVDADDDGGLVHKEERPEEKEPDYVDRLLAQKAARHKSDHPLAAESRQNRFSPLPAAYASEGFQNCATGLLEAADALLPDDTDHLDAQFAEEWEALIDEVTDHLLAAQESDGLDLDADETDSTPPKSKDKSSGKKGKDDSEPKKVKEGRRLTARDLTDRLLS